MTTSDQHVVVIATALNWAKVQLSTSNENPALEAEILLAHVLQQPRSYLHAWPEKPLNAKQNKTFSDLVLQRYEGHPIAFLIGQREFWDITLQVTADTLIPRPETELLVEMALQLIPKNAQWQIADLGTGSGAIALAIAKHRPQCQITATDNSSLALAIAHKNATKLEISNVECVQSNWFSALAGKMFDLIISNPPYVAVGDKHLTQGDLRFEPQLALASGIDGLDDIRYISQHAAAHLTSNAYLMFEHGFDQAQHVRNILANQHFIDVCSHQDLSHNDRITMGKRPANKLA